MPFLVPDRDMVLHTIGLDSARYACTISWFDKRSLSVIAVSLVLTMMVATVIFLFFCYASICLLFLKSVRQAAMDLRSNLSNSISASADKTSAKATSSHVLHGKELSVMSTNKAQMMDKENQLVIKSVSLCLSFFACHAPYVGKILYEIFTSRPVGQEFDLFCHFIISTYSFFNCLLLVTMDVRVKSKFQALFRLT